MHLDIKGISIDREDDNTIYLTVNAGENWHELVIWCVSNNYGGIENLSLIPGNVGTCPIQNIGAYGVEVKDTITKVEALEIETGKLIQFSNESCNFEYRNSLFKNKEKGKYIAFREQTFESVSYRMNDAKVELKVSPKIKNQIVVISEKNEGKSSNRTDMIEAINTMDWVSIYYLSRDVHPNNYNNELPSVNDVQFERLINDIKELT